MVPLFTVGTIHEMVLPLAVDGNAVQDFGDITSKLTDGLVMPDRVAVILVFPVTTPVAKPDEEMVAIVVSELAQVT
jgi:hypothetical protein